jgi:Domain of unknown function (DUF4375)
MKDVKWLDRYSGQSVEELIALAPEYRVDSIVLAFEEALLHKMGELGPSGLNEAEHTVLAIEALEREVNNGGYHQFFLNAPEYVSCIVAALERIDCPNTAKISQVAITHLGVRQPFTTEQVQTALGQDADGNLARILNERCDRLFFNSGEPIESRLFDFVRANAQAIGLRR